VVSKISTEPTGDAFNSISLEPGTGRPRNPMINAGAIATTSLIAGKSANTRLRRVLETALPNRSPDRGAGHGQYELLENFTSEEVAVIASLLRRRSYQQGEVIINAGDEAGEMFFLVRGSASVFVRLESGGRKRLATFSAGMVFGEMAVIDRAPRSAMIVADSQIECDELNVEDFERLGTTHPQIKIKLLENLSLCLCRRLRKANRKLSVFD
jgi:glutaminase